MGWGYVCFLLLIAPCSSSATDKPQSPELSVLSASDVEAEIERVTKLSGEVHASGAEFVEKGREAATAVGFAEACHLTASALYAILTRDIRFEICLFERGLEKKKGWTFPAKTSDTNPLAGHLVEIRVGANKKGRTGYQSHFFFVLEKFVENAPRFVVYQSYGDGDAFAYTVSDYIILSKQRDASAIPEDLFDRLSWDINNIYDDDRDAYDTIYDSAKFYGVGGGGVALADIQSILTSIAPSSDRDIVAAEWAHLTGYYFPDHGDKSLNFVGSYSQSQINIRSSFITRATIDKVLLALVCEKPTAFYCTAYFAQDGADKEDKLHTAIAGLVAKMEVLSAHA